MAVERYRGVERSAEVALTTVRPDTRSARGRRAEFLSSTDGVNLVAMCVPVVALLMCWLPFSGEFLAITLVALYRGYVRTEGRRYDFPFRVPKHAQVLDGSISDKKMGEGITFLGKEISSRLEIWSGNSDLRTHMLVLGTTGSGKTEMLLGLVYNALVQNSGFIYTDDKGDIALFNNVFRLARYLGREDDLLSVNFLTSGRDFLDKQADRTTNTMNPFAMGSSGMLIELIIALMDDSGGGGDMWKGRAIAFVAALTRVVTFLRDRGYLLLDASTFLNYFELPTLERLVWDKRIPAPGGNSIKDDTIKIEDPMFEMVLEPLRAYISNIPGYKREAQGKQEQKTLEQHGFITMQLTRLFGDLSFTYGYLFQTTLGEVDMYDVVLNRRILVVLLPSLERAPDSLKMLGKLIVGAIKQMMAGCLGNRTEGRVRELVDARVTNAPVPYYVVLDEYGYYAVLGFAVAPAQARSLGFNITFAAQDFSSLQKASKEEADATWENTNVRIIGRLTSGSESETWRRISGAAGEVNVYEMTDRQREVGTFRDRFTQSESARLTRVKRLEYDDVSKQENGEFTFLIGKKDSKGEGGVRIIRARTFYTQNNSEHEEIRLNHFIKIEPPRTGEGAEEIEMLDNLERAMTELLQSGTLAKVFPAEAGVPTASRVSTDIAETALYLRRAQDSYQLSLAEAVRVAIACRARNKILKEQQTGEQRRINDLKIQEESLATVRAMTEAAAAKRSMVDPLVEGIREIVEDEYEAETTNANVDRNEEFESIDDDEALPSILGKEDYSAKVDEEEGQSEGSDEGKGSSGGQGGGSTGGSAGSLSAMLRPTEIDDVVPEHVISRVPVGEREVPRENAASLISAFLSDDLEEELTQTTPLSPEQRNRSAFTLRTIGSETPTAISEVLEDAIVNADVLIGEKRDILAIREGAEATVRQMESVTSYVDGATPDVPTVAEFEKQLEDLVLTIESSSDDFLH